MKNLKKLLAIFLSIAMVMCSTLPSFASETETTVGASEEIVESSEETLVDETSRGEACEPEEEPEEDETSTGEFHEPEEEPEEDETSTGEFHEPEEDVGASEDSVGASTASPEEESESIVGDEPEEDETSETLVEETSETVGDDILSSQEDETESTVGDDILSSHDETTESLSELKATKSELVSKEKLLGTYPAWYPAWLYWKADGETLHLSSTDPGGYTIIEQDPASKALYYEGLNKSEITTAVFDNEVNAPSCFEFFKDFSNLSEIQYLSRLKTNSVTDMMSMFYNCSSLTSLDLRDFDTSNVTKFSSMFRNCSSLKRVDLSGWDTSKIDFMSCMFYNCSSLEEIIVSDTFVTTQVTGDRDTEMFAGCTSLKGGAGTTYDGGHTNKEYARIDRPGLGEPGYFTRAPWMYWYLTYSGSEIHFSSTDPGGANPISSEIEVDYPTGLAKSNIDFAVFDNEINAVTCKGFFAGFTRLQSIYQSGRLKTNNVKDMTNMFYNCQSLQHLTISLDTSNVEDMTNMFGNCQSLNALGLYNFDTSKVKTMNKMFENCESLDHLYLNHFDTSSVTTMASMFKNCKPLNNLILSSNFTTAEVTDMESMFESCERLNNPDLSSFNTSKVTNMKSMFKGCSGLVKLDLNKFDTSNVENTQYMFDGCSSLEKIIVSSKFNTLNVTSSNDMFASCTNLVGGAGTTYDDSHTDIEYARIDGGPTSATPGYFTLYVPPTPPAPYYPGGSSGSSGSSGGGGGGGGGPVTEDAPGVTYLPYVKSIIGFANNLMSKWSQDAMSSKWKLSVTAENSLEANFKNGFILYTHISTHIVGNTSVQTAANNTYVFDENGNMITGWVHTADGKTYFFENKKTSDEGRMIIGWKQIQGSWYYFGADGAMYANTVTPDGHPVGPDGKWQG